MLEVLVPYSYEDILLLVIEEENMFWLTEHQLRILFSCNRGRIQLMLQNIRRVYPNVYSYTMRKIPLVLQEKNSFTKELHETVRCIQHFNYKMVEFMLAYNDSIIAQDYLIWNARYHFADPIIEEESGDIQV